MRESAPMCLGSAFESLFRPVFLKVFCSRNSPVISYFWFSDNITSLLSQVCATCTSKNTLFTLCSRKSWKNSWNYFEVAIVFLQSFFVFSPNYTFHVSVPGFDPVFITRMTKRANRNSTRIIEHATNKVFRLHL